jgi:hypothetical protein
MHDDGNAGRPCDQRAIGGSGSEKRAGQKNEGKRERLDRLTLLFSTGGPFTFTSSQGNNTTQFVNE